MIYTLTPKALDDLDAIADYTMRQWGETQTVRYIAALETGIDNAVCGRGLFKEITVMSYSACMAHIGHHYVFWLPRADDSAQIIGIFHERADYLTRLAGRLPAPNLA